MTIIRATYATVILIASTLLLGCDSTQTEAERAAETAALFQQGLPASYQGHFACADCPDITYHLTVFEDQAFYLRTVSPESAEPDPVYHLGQWQLRDNSKLSLLSDVQNFDFSLNADQSISLLNQTDVAADSELKTTLQRGDDFLPVYPELLMRGVFSYMADAGFFKECLTGQQWPVVQLADNRELEKQYLEMQNKPNQSLFVTFDGQLIAQENPDTGELHTAVIVQHFKGIWPVEACAEPGFTENLLDTYWQLERLQGEDVIAANPKQLPTLKLASGDEVRVSGSDGCNRMMGSYQLRENRLKFSKLASTMMACPSGMETAQAYHVALEQVQFWNISGQTLTLFDRENAAVAQFLAIPDPA